MPKAVFKGWAGRDTGNVTGGTTITKYGNTPELLRRVLSHGPGSRKLRAVLLALTGSVVGQSKAVNATRISAGSNGGQSGINAIGGKRTVETVAIQTGNTTAQDLTDMDTSLVLKSRLASYPKDKSGFAPGNINKL